MSAFASDDDARRRHQPRLPVVWLTGFVPVKALDEVLATPNVCVGKKSRKHKNVYNGAGGGHTQVAVGLWRAPWQPPSSPPSCPSPPPLHQLRRGRRSHPSATCCCWLPSPLTWQRAPNRSAAAGQLRHQPPACRRCGVCERGGVPTCRSLHPRRALTAPHHLSSAAHRAPLRHSSQQQLSFRCFIFEEK